MDNGLIFPYLLTLNVTDLRSYCVVTEYYVEAVMR